MSNLTHVAPMLVVGDLEPHEISGRQLAQDAHDLQVARQHVNLKGEGKLKLAPA